MLEFIAAHIAYINVFESWVLAQFSDIEDPNLGGIQKQVATLQAEVCSLIKSQILDIPLAIPIFAQFVPP